jgi:hypothetical protein
MRIVVLAAAALCAGCASVTRGTSEQVSFDSTPSGAEVRTIVLSRCGDQPCRTGNAERDAGPTQMSAEPTPGPSCVTPCTIAVARADKLLATFTKPGYRPQQIVVDTRVAGAGAVGFAGNVIVGGGVGMVVDAASGATLEHFPNPVVVTLAPAGGTPPAIAAPRKKKAKG